MLAMKALLRVAALLSFLPCFIAGLMILGNAIATGYKDAWILSALGFVFIGLAVFVGSILLFVAERVGGKANH
jgi:hypothetical protein